jgi:hypothetical protein
MISDSEKSSDVDISFIDESIQLYVSDSDDSDFELEKSHVKQRKNDLNISQSCKFENFYISKI